MSLKEISRRRFLMSSGAVASAAYLGFPLGGAEARAANSQLVMVTWGGTTQRAFEDIVAKPYTEETGIPVKVTAPVNYGKYSAQLKRGKIEWNWVDIEGWFAYKRKKYWVDDLASYVGVDTDDFISLPGAGAFPSWGIPSNSYSFAIAYRTDPPGPHPQSWEEFFDPQGIPGIRSIYNWPFGMIEAALLADGVPSDSLYPLDVDRALDKLDQIRGQLVFWNSGAELQRQLVAGTTRFAFAWNNRVAYLAQRGQPVDLEWQDNIQNGGYDVIAKEDPLRDEVAKFLAFMNGPEVAFKLAMASGYSPTSYTALHRIPKERIKWYNTYEPNLAKAGAVINNQWWADNLQEVAKKWTLWASS